MFSFLWVGIGGFIGSLLRYSASLLLPAQPLGFPYPTLIVNVLGSFAIGCIYTLSSRSAMSDEARLFLGVGVCGGFTTFSALSLETITMVREGNLWMACLYALLSLLLGLCATYAGIAAAR